MKKFQTSLWWTLINGSRRKLFLYKREWAGMGKACTKLWRRITKKEKLCYEARERQRLSFAYIEAFACKLFGVLLINISYFLWERSWNKPDLKTLDLCSHLRKKKNQVKTERCLKISLLAACRRLNFIFLKPRKFLSSNLTVVTIRGKPRQQPHAWSATLSALRAEHQCSPSRKEDTSKP